MFVVVVATSAQQSMSLGRGRSGVPSLTSKVGSTLTKHTFLSNCPLCIIFKSTYFSSMLQHKIINITGGDQILVIPKPFLK